MPTVPRLRPQVDLQPLPGVRKQAAETFESLGGRAALAQGDAAATVGEGMARLGAQATNVFAELAAKAKAQADETAVNAAANQLSSWVDDYGYKGAAPFFGTKGAAAMQAGDKALPDFDQAADAIAGGLKNDDQRRAFAVFADRKRGAWNDDINKHLFAEGQQMFVDSANARIKNAQDDAIRHATSEPEFRANMADMEQTIRSVGDKLGWKPEELDLNLRNARTVAHVGAIDALSAQGRYGDAKAWLDKYAGEMDAKTVDAKREQLAQETKVADETTEAQRVRDEALAAHPGDLDAQRAYVKDHLKGTVQNAALSMVEHESVVSDALADQKRADLYEQGFAIIDRGRGFGAIPATILAGLKPTQIAKLREYATAKDKPEGAAMTTAGHAEYLRLMELAATNPAKFLEMSRADVVGLRGVLDSTHYEHVVAMRTGLLGKAAEAQATRADLARFTTVEDVYKTVLRSAGFLPGEITMSDSADKENPERVKTVGRIRLLMAYEEQAYNKEHGTKMPVEEFRKSLMRAVQGLQNSTGGDLSLGPMYYISEAVSPGSGVNWLNRAPLRKMQDMTPADIPPADIPKLDQWLYKIGEPITPDSRLALWWASRVGFGAAPSTTK